MLKFAGKPLACIAFALALISSGCANQSRAVTSAKASSNRKPAPEFALQDSNGKSVKLSDLKGKVVLLNFWATWCGPCALEIPWFIEFQQQYRNQGLEIVGVSMDEEGWAAVKPYIAQRKINYRVLLGNDSVGQLYNGVDSLPTTYLIDREGRIAYPPHVGLAGKNEYLQEIQTLLKDGVPGSGERQTRNAVGTAAGGANLLADSARSVASR